MAATVSGAPRPATAPAPGVPYARLVELARAGDRAGVARLACGELRAALTAEAVPAPAPGRPYGRRPLHLGADGEVLLMAWREGAVSAIHDHGGAAGVVVALEGDLAEELIDLRATTGIEPVVLHRRPLLRGSAMQVAADGFHLMRAPRGGLSLHIYTPRPHGMQIADLEARCIWHVDDGHGAWLPIEPERVLRSTRWPT